MSRRGFTLTEILVVLLLLGIVLGLLLFNGHKGMANREQDRAGREVCGALRLARQLAVSRNGASLRLVSGTAGQKASYTISAGGQVERIGEFASDIQFDSRPSFTLTFLSNGSLSDDYAVTIRSLATNRTTVLLVHKLTGAVEVQ